MKAGIAFEILVKRILISVGFSEVQSDGTYIYMMVLLGKCYRG